MDVASFFAFRLDAKAGPLFSQRPMIKTKSLRSLYMCANDGQYMMTEDTYTSMGIVSLPSFLQSKRSSYVAVVAQQQIRI